MAGDFENKSDLERILELLHAHGVQFVLIGGQAEMLYGSARVTYDTDLCYRRSGDNLEALAAALKELNVSLRDAPPDLPFRLDARSLALGSNFTLRSSLGDLDLLSHVEPIGGFEELSKTAEEVPFGDIKIKVISLNDLIRIKEYLGRPKDREGLRQLLNLKRLREQDHTQ